MTTGLSGSLPKASYMSEEERLRSLSFEKGLSDEGAKRITRKPGACPADYRVFMGGVRHPIPLPLFQRSSEFLGFSDGGDIPFFKNLTSSHLTSFCL